jgi:hypothetical protein
MKLSGEGKPLRDLVSSRSGRERRGEVGILSEGCGCKQQSVCPFNPQSRQPTSYILSDVPRSSRRGPEIDGLFLEKNLNPLLGLAVEFDRELECEGCRIMEDILDLTCVRCRYRINCGSENQIPA